MNRTLKAKKQLRYLLIFSPVIVFAFAYVLPELPSSPMKKEEFWVSKVSQNKVYDIVYTGDSRIYRGIDPQVIDKLLNCKSYNFGFSSAGLDSFLLNRAALLLKEDGKKILLIGISANAFMPSSLKNEHLHQYLNLSKADRCLRKEFYAHLSFFDARAVSDLYKFMKGEGYYEKFNPLTGFVSSNKLPFDSASALKAYREQFEHEQSEPSASDKFLNQLSVLQKKGLKIVLLRMPVTHSMRILEDRYTNHLCDTLMRRAERQGVYLINVQDLKIESYDGSHLSSQSAARVTWSIGEAIHRLPLDYDADKR